MNKRLKFEIVRVLCFWPLLWWGGGANAIAAEAPGKKPNIVFFFVDDMGWQDTSVPFHSEVTELNKRYRTPNMERLARQGMKFTQAYAAALCSPSRVSLMTGLNAARHRVTNWTLRKNVSPDPRHPRLEPPPWNVNGLSAEPGVERTVHAVTLAAILKRSGYRTIHAGKAHWGAKDTPGENPLRLGFDVNIAGHYAGGPGSYLGTNNFSAAWRNADRIWDVPGLEKYHGQDIHLTEALTREANRAVDAAVAAGKPFYLYMSHYAVHAPWEADSRFLEKYSAAGLEGLPAIFASMIEGMDRSLGDILDNLKRHGVERNTIVVFMSDNGCPRNLPRNRPLRGHKITPYEGGVRVPLIVKWPGVTEAGSVCNRDYVIVEDLFPTFLEMTGAGPFRDQIGGVVDGKSFVPLLRGESGLSRGRSIFWHFPHTYDQPAYSSVRRDAWKLIYHHDSRQLELFNLIDDLGESDDLTDRRPEKVAEMADILAGFLRSSNAQMPVDMATGKPVEFPDAIQRSNRGPEKDRVQ